MDDMYSDSLIDASGPKKRWSDTATDHVSHKRGAVILVDPVIYDPKHESAVKSASTEIEAQLAASGTAEMVATWRALLQEPPMSASVSGEYLFTTRDDLFNTEPIQQLKLSAVSWKPKSAAFLRNLQSVGLVRLILNAAGPKPALWHLPWPFNFQSDLGQGGSQNPSASALQLNLVEEEGGPTQLWDTMYQVMSHVLPMESEGEDGAPLKQFKGQFAAYDNRLEQTLTTNFSTTIPSDVDGSVMTVGDRGVLAVIDMMCLNRIQAEVDRQRVPRNEFTLDMRDLARAIGYKDVRLQQLVEVTAVVKRILFTQTHSSTEIDIQAQDDVSEITKEALNGIMRAFESPRWGTRVREGMEVYEFVQFSLQQKKFDAMVQRSRNGTPMIGDIPRLVTRLGRTGRGKRGLLSDAGMIVLVDLAYTYVVKRKARTWRYDELHHVFRLTQDSDKQRFEKVNRVLKKLIQIASPDPKTDLAKFDGHDPCKIVMAYDEIELHLEFNARAPRKRRVGTLTLKGRTAAISSDQKTPEQPSNPDLPNDTPKNQVDGAGEDSPLVNELIRHGVEAKSAHQVVAEFSEKQVRENLAYAGAAMASKSKKNPAGYILACIQNNYANSSPAPSLATPDQSKSKPKDVKKEVMKLVYAYQRAQGDHAQLVKEESDKERVKQARFKAEDAADDLQKALTPYGLEREINLIRDLNKLEDLEGIETALKQVTSEP